MKYEKIINAMPMLNNLKLMQLPYNKAREIYNLYKILENEWNFFVEEQRKIILKYGQILDNGDIKFEKKEDKQSYLTEFKSLSDQEINVKLSKIILCEKDLNNQTITVDMITKLEDIVSFE